MGADSFEYVLSFNFAVQPKKFVVKVSPYAMDNYVCCITLAWLLWRFAFDAVMASKGICDKTLKPVDPVYILFGCHTAASRPPFCHRKALWWDLL